MNLILSKYVITNQIAQRADVLYKAIYVTLSINSDRIGDIQTVFSDLLLMLQNLLSWGNISLQTQLNMLQASYTMFIKKEKNCHSQENIYDKQVLMYSPNCINVHVLQRKVIIQNLF